MVTLAADDAAASFCIPFLRALATNSETMQGSEVNETPFSLFFEE
jgi:hypothetical protein